MLKFLPRLTCLILVIMLLASCDSRPPATNGSIDRTETLRRGNGGDPGTLDPALAEDVHAFAVLTDIYEGLTVETSDGRIAPGVAESWTVSEDGLVYTFKLRSNARWSNGDVVSADDFVRAFRRVASPDTPAVFGFLLEPVEQFKAVKSGNLEVGALGVLALNQSTLQIRLTQNTPYFLSILALPISYPLHVSKEAEQTFADPQDFLGNGPYRLVQSIVGSRIVLQRNEMYWNAASVYFSAVEYFPTTDPNTELNMYRSGELQITNTVPPEDFPILENSIPNELRVAPSLALYYLAFDLTEAPLDDLSLREALSMAIDRPQLVKLIGRGEQPAYSVVPPGVANHMSFEYAWRNDDDDVRIQRAQEKYAEAGYSDANPATINLTYDVSDIHERVALIVSSMWRDVLGVEVTLEKKEWKYFLDTRANRPAWDVMRFGWIGDYNDPFTFLEIFGSASLQNLPSYKSNQYDEIIGQSIAETDMKIRIEALTTAESVLLGDYPIAPLYFFVSKHLVDTRISGFESNVLDRHPSQYLSLSSTKN